MAEPETVPKVEEVDTTVDAPEESTEAKPADGDKPAARKNARAEKKMKDAFLKHNLTKLENVSTVMMRKTGSISWSFDSPEVYFLENCYVVFGEPNTTNPAEDAVRELKTTAGGDVPSSEPTPTVVEDGGEIDTAGLREEDIATIMQQTSVTRARAAEALREAGGDLVTAVMNLAL
jgi:nascent polypeptide-associated complex subunit alpha